MQAEPGGPANQQQAHALEAERMQGLDGKAIEEEPLASYSEGKGSEDMDFDADPGADAPGGQDDPLLPAKRKRKPHHRLLEANGVADGADGRGQHRFQTNGAHSDSDGGSSSEPEDRRGSRRSCPPCASREDSLSRKKSKDAKVSLA